METSDKSGTLQFYGGMAGSLAPFVLFLAGVAWLALSGAPDEKGFWPVQLAALALSLILAKSKRRYCETLLSGIAQPIVAMMIMAWTLAGVLGTLLSASGFIQSLIWAAQRAHVAGGGYVGVAFVVCCIVATSTGTSLGTILLCGPLLYPAGGPLHSDPAMLMGGILAGATFGDSISPMSDTTIASSGTQGADIGGVVRARLKYVVPAGLIAGAGLSLFGNAGVGVSTSYAPFSGATARSLVMLAVPALVIAMLLRKRHILEGLFAGILLSTALGLMLRLIQPSQLLYIDAASFTARGLIIDGMQRAVGVSFFTIFLIGLVATLRATELLERLIEFARRHAHSARNAEFWIAGSVSAAVLLTTHSVVAILTVGDFAKETGQRLGLSAYRRANLLDMTVCTHPFLFPYFIPTILAASTTVSAAAFGMPKLSPWSVGLHNLYSWGLLAMVVFAIVSGYGRGEKAQQEISA